MSSRSIPPDLYRPIVEAVDYNNRRTLLALTQTSHSMNAEATPRLYHDFDIADMMSQKLFFHTVDSSDRLSRMVFKFKVEFDEEHENERDDLYWELISTALRSLINLKHLIMWNEGSTAVAHILQGCTFELQVFNWRSYEDEKDLQAILRCQASMQEARLELHQDFLFQSPSPIFQNLTTLAGNYAAVLALLPGSQLKKLHWMPIPDDPDPDLPTISKKLENLRVFIYGGIRTDGPQFKLIANQLSNVSHLELRGITEIPHFRTLQQEAFDCVPNFKKLTHLTLSRGYYEEQCVGLSRSPGLAAGLFKKIKSLEFVDIDVGLDTGEYSRWTRGTDMFTFEDKNDSFRFPWDRAPVIRDVSEEDEDDDGHEDQ